MPSEKRHEGEGVEQEDMKFFERLFRSFKAAMHQRFDRMEERFDRIAANDLADRVKRLEDSKSQ